MTDNPYAPDYKKAWLDAEERIRKKEAELRVCEDALLEIDRSHTRNYWKIIINEALYKLKSMRSQQKEGGE